MRPLVAACAGMALALLGSATAAQAQQTTVVPQKQLQDVTDILERIRQDIGYYEVQAAGWRGEPGLPKVDDPAMAVPAHHNPPDQTHPGGEDVPARQVKSLCPGSLSNYDFDIVNVELSLNAVAESTASGDLKLKIPYVGASVGPDVNGSVTHTGSGIITIDRVVNFDVDTLKAFTLTDDYKTLVQAHNSYVTTKTPPKNGQPASPVFPISNTLISLRQSLVQATEKLPCFDAKANEDVKDSLKLEFQVQEAADPNVGFTLLIISVKAGDKIQNSSDNSITITFAPYKSPAPAAKAP